jgi:hypothetical protein
MRVKLRCGHAVLQLDLDQAEVGGAAADVGHQHQARAASSSARVSRWRCSQSYSAACGSSSRRRLGRPARRAGFQRERARAFVEGSGDGQDQVLVFQRTLGKARVPGRAQVGEIAGAGRQRRDLRDIVRRAPGQDGRGAVDAVVRQPALGRCN